MILSTILGCLAIGIILSAPMGPIGMLCVQRTLNKGREAGFWTGLGAAASDLFYCLLTGLGMSFVTTYIESNLSILQVVGSVILLGFGIYMLKRSPAPKIKENPEKKETHYQDMVTGFFLTLSNPLIIFLIIPLFARFTFPTPEPASTWPIIILGYVSIVGGAVLWWFVLTHLVNKVRNQFNLRSMQVINYVIGGIIILLAIFGLVKGLNNYIHFL